jgi:hypothetical protein
MDRGLLGNEHATDATLKTGFQLGIFDEKEAEPVWDFSSLTDDELETFFQLRLKVKQR